MLQICEHLRKLINSIFCVEKFFPLQYENAGDFLLKH